MKTYVTFVALLISAIFMLTAAGRADAALTATANHSRIMIDSLYHGSTVSVRGEYEKDTDLIITITSPEGHESLLKKGKVGGVLWMNTGSIKFGSLPGFYALRSTRAITDIINPDEMNSLGIGYEALEKNSEVTPVADDAEKARCFAEYIRYKESLRLYGTSLGGFEYSEKDGHPEYYTLFDWPYQAQPGAYTVTVYSVKDGHVIDKSESPVVVEQDGMVRTLSNMAKNNGALYGVIAIVIALGAGMGVGLVFGKGGGSH